MVVHGGGGHCDGRVAWLRLIRSTFVGIALGYGIGVEGIHSESGGKRVRCTMLRDATDVTMRTEREASPLTRDQRVSTVNSPAEPAVAIFDSRTEGRGIIPLADTRITHTGTCVRTAGARIPNPDKNVRTKIDNIESREITLNHN
jgi:hypothetical protein